MHQRAISALLQLQERLLLIQSGIKDERSFLGVSLDGPFDHICGAGLLLSALRSYLQQWHAQLLLGYPCGFSLDCAEWCTTISRLEQSWHEVKADLHAEIHYENADNVVMGQWRQELFARSLQGIATPCKVALLQ